MSMQWVLLWSQSRNALHVETLARMLENNRFAYRENHPSDFVTLVIGDRKLIDDTVQNLRPTLERRTLEAAR